MSRGNPIFYGALMLTGVNFLLRFAGTSFQVYLSGVIGAAGVGLLQLVLSVNFLAMTASMAGIRTTAMYLSAEELGQKRSGNVRWVLSGCFIYCAVTGGAVSLGVFHFAPLIATHWIGSADAVDAIRTYAAFLPVVCLCGVMTGYFTAANRIATLAAVEVAEQLCTMGMTFLLLLRQPDGSAAASCRAVALGSGCGAVLTLSCLLVLYIRTPFPSSPRIAVGRRICSAAIPLALADDLKAGISALENLMVPRRLALYPGVESPLALFGTVTGMVFPVILFPCAILSSLSELLIPELARCAAVGSRRRIAYLVRRNLRVTFVYGLICGGLLYVWADMLCGWLYPGVDAAKYIRWFAPLVPMLYCDQIVDGMTKGLGQQRHCVRYNILTNGMDVIFLYFLLPEYGIFGYYTSFLITHAVNFLLSLRRLTVTGQVTFSTGKALTAIGAAMLCVRCAQRFTGPMRQCGAFLGLFAVMSFLCGILHREDLKWLAGLVRPSRQGQKNAVTEP